jgi:hypothetical protein
MYRINPYFLRSYGIFVVVDGQMYWQTKFEDVLVVPGYVISSYCNGDSDHYICSSRAPGCVRASMIEFSVRYLQGFILPIYILCYIIISNQYQRVHFSLWNACFCCYWLNFCWDVPMSGQKSTAPRS